MFSISKFRHIGVALAVAALGLSGCAAPDSTAGSSGSGGAGGADGSTITKSWDLAPVDSVEALVPKEFKNKPINNAIYNNFPPQEFLEGDTLVGIQPDIVLALSEVMGVELNNESVATFDSIIPGLTSGRYDMASADFGVTEDRLRQVDFVTEFAIGTAFAVKEGSDITIEEATDLCGHSVGVIVGSYFIEQIEGANEDCTAAGLDEIDLQRFPDDGARTLAITNGRVEITATTQDAMGYAIERQDVPIEMQSFVYEPLEQAIAFPDGSKLVPAAEAAMKEIIRNGTYDKIMEKWGVQDIAYDSPDQVLNLTNPGQAS